MTQPGASWLTVQKGDIDPYTSIEILWHADTHTLHLLTFRLSRGAGRPQLTTEETGPYRCLIELRQQIGVLFGEIVAQRLCRNPNSWLPPEQHKLLTAGLRTTARTAPSSASQPDYRTHPLAAPAPLASVPATETQCSRRSIQKLDPELLPAFGGQTALW